MRSVKIEDKELARLRINIESVTKSIIDLVGARQQLSLEVARIKRKRGLPIENLQVEANLAKDISKYANKIGVDESLARAILSEMLLYSKVVQRQLFYAESIKDFLRTEGIRTVGIVGAGRMGGWFASYFSSLVPRVVLFDASGDKASKLAKQMHLPKKKTDLGWIANNSDLVVACVPIGKSVSLIRKVRSLRGRSEKLRIIEITSVKSPLVESGLLNKHDEKLELISIHPLFGPDAKGFGSNLIIDVTPGDVRSNFVRKLFPHYKVLVMNPEEHDRAMSYVLALPHILALAFGKMVTQNAELESNLEKGLLGPSFDRMIQLASRVLSENPNVYFEIQSMNKYNTGLVGDLEKALLEIRKSRGDRSRFKKLFVEMGKSRTFG